MKLKIVLTLIIISFLTLIFYQYLQQSKNTVIQNLANQTLVLTSTAYKAIIDTYQVTSERHFLSIINNSNVVNILKDFKHANKEQQAILRGELYRLLYKEYQQLKTFNVRQFHFHTIEGNSLLRFHLPYKSGDSLINVRKSIWLANTKLQKVTGFEGGRAYPGYRYVFPIISNKEHLGSVEFSISFEGIEKKLTNILSFYAHQLILEKEISYDKVFKQYKALFQTSDFDSKLYIENPKLSKITHKIQNNPFIAQLTALTKKSHNFKQLLHQKDNFSVPIIYKKKGYVVNFLAIKDTENKPAAYIVSFGQLNDIVEIEKTYHNYILSGLAIMLVIAVLVIIIITQRNKSQLHQKKLEKLEAIALSMSAAQNTAHLGSWERDLIQNKLYWSDEVFNIFGNKPQSFEPCFKHFLDFIHPEDKNRVIETYRHSLAKKSAYHIHYRLIRKDGGIRYVHETGKYEFDHHGRLLKIIGTIHNITEIISYEKKLFQKLQKFIDIQDSIVILTNSLKINFANKKFFDFFGYENLNEFLKDYNCIIDRFINNDSFFHRDKVSEGEQNWIESLLNLPGRQRIVSILDKSSVPHAFTVSINQFNSDSYVINFSDISDNMIEKLQLQKQAIHDPLTAAFNRVYFDNSIKNIIELNKNEHKKTGVIFFDIDHFKQINDNYGHKVGDNILKALVLLVKKHIRENDPLIRWGGEEFLIITSTDSLQDIHKQAEYTRSIIEHHQFTDIEKLTCSFGVAIYEEGDDINHTIKTADKKLYEAKSSGRNKVVA